MNDEKIVQNLDGKGGMWQDFYSIIRKIKFLSSKDLRVLHLQLLLALVLIILIHLAFSHESPQTPSFPKFGNA